MPDREKTVELKIERKKPIMIGLNGIRVIEEDEFCSPMEIIERRRIASRLADAYGPEVLLPYLRGSKRASLMTPDEMARTDYALAELSRAQKESQVKMNGYNGTI